MSSNKILLDTSFLYSFLNKDDPSHERVRSFFVQEKPRLIIPLVILPETAFLFRRAGGMPAVAGFLRTVVALEFPFEETIKADLTRAQAMMQAYPKAELDFVDCAISAIAERLNITEIGTLDRRDFSIIRPSHVSYFAILPSP
ncbi:MAG: type II toxin-antitoxin system VapC family toxin [Phototrophicaceae bacterium]